MDEIEDVGGSCNFHLFPGPVVAGEVFGHLLRGGQVHEILWWGVCACMMWPYPGRRADASAASLLFALGLILSMTVSGGMT